MTEFKNKNHKIDIFYNTTVESVKGWQNINITWEQFILNYLTKPNIQKGINSKELRECTKYSHLTNKELKDLRKEDPDKWNDYQSQKKKLAPFKKVACVMGGKFEGDQRKETNMLYRNLMALDIDKGNERIISTIRKVFSEYEYFYHTSFSHLTDKPKLRVFFPLKEQITEKVLYSQLVEAFIIKNGLTIESDSTVGDCDRASLKFNQVMFLPNKTSNGEFLIHHNKGNLVSLLDFKKDISITDIKDTTPKTLEETIKNESIKDNQIIKLDTVKSPYDMEDTSIIKEFCIKYNIHMTIDKWLKDVYTKETNDCYTYNFGSSTKGLRVYPDKHNNKAVYVYSNHGTDKVNDGKLHNSFDILKVHKFNNDKNKTLEFCKNILGKNEVTQKLTPVNGLNFLNSINEKIDNYKNLPVYSTGFKQLDEYLSGGFRKYLYVLGAGSSMGKTTFVQQLADNVAQKGNDVLFFSMEQTVLELMTKSMSRLSYLNDKNDCLSHNEIMQGYSCSEINIVVNQYKEYAERITYFEADMGTTVLSIENEITNHIEKTGNKPLIIIDYLQVLGSMNDRDDTKKAIEKTVKKLKMITKYLEVPIVVLSSLNRDSYYMPVSYESFKETGGIEYTCDCLMGLQYKTVSEINNAKTGQSKSNKSHIKKEIEENNTRQDENNNYFRTLELTGLKNRSGKQTCKIDINYIPKYNVFSDEVKRNPFEINNESIQDNPFKPHSKTGGGV